MLRACTHLEALMLDNRGLEGRRFSKGDPLLWLTNTLYVCRVRRAQRTARNAEPQETHVKQQSSARYCEYPYLTFIECNMLRSDASLEALRSLPLLEELELGSCDLQGVCASCTH
jgi:hypothetical protein